MNYRDVYFSRVNHLGTTTAERIRNAGVRSFEKWMAESPHTVRDLSVERGIYFDGIILTSKDKEYEKIMFLNVSNDTNILIGDIMNWIVDDGSTEKWIVVQEEKKVNGTYKTFWIIRCNYLIKWIDIKGHLQQSWCYFVSSLDSKIKGNYRTWHNLITPQPNKYAEILMPCREIERSTNFIVEDESWTVIEYDHTSVPGTVYLSLTENKINRIYDDTVNNIADTDERAIYSIAKPAEIQHFTVGDIIIGENNNLVYTIMKNGIPFTPQKINYISRDKQVVDFVDTTLTALKKGETTIVIELPEWDDIEPQNILEVPIIIDDATSTFSFYIDGPDAIHLDDSVEYTLKSIDGSALRASTINISNPSLAKCKFSTDSEKYVIQSNAKNELGTFNFTATVIQNDIEYTATKTIAVIPLW